ncbi:MAG: hypothetical protein AB1608_04150 [Thermoproteota archaeon]
MGFSIVLAGGIAGAAMIAVFSILFSITGQVYEINSSRTQSTELQSAIFQTNMSIKSIATQSGSQYVNFTLKNTGNEKLWNYEKFDVIINYTANILGVPTPRVEQFSYADSAEISVNSVSSDNEVCSTCTLSHTVAGTVKLLLVAVSIGDDTAVTNITYSNQSLTRIRFDEITTTDRRSELWYLVNPPSGTANVVVTLDKNEQIVFGAISLTGVHQSNPIDAHNGSTDATGTTEPSTSLTTTVDNAFIVDVVSTVDGTMTPGASQTERWDLAQGQLAGSASTEQATIQTSYTMSWTNDGGTDQWAMSAAALRPSDPICGPDGTFATNDWAVVSIAQDYVDPDIINTNELASICAKLAYPVYTNGLVQIKISTDIGYTKTNSTTAS